MEIVFSIEVNSPCKCVLIIWIQFLVSFHQFCFSAHIFLCLWKICTSLLTKNTNFIAWFADCRSIHVQYFFLWFKPYVYILVSLQYPSFESKLFVEACFIIFFLYSCTTAAIMLYISDSKEDPTSDPSLRPLFPSRSQSEISKSKLSTGFYS